VNRMVAMPGYAMCERERFSDAVWSGDLATVELMIGSGADVNAAAEDRWPPLFLAIEQRWIEIIHRLIAAGADIDRDLGDGWRPLVYAIDIESDTAWQAHHETGHEPTEVTELLLAAGAVLTERAFEIAEDYGNQRGLHLLRSYSGRP
jgi:uncharacterized protein